MVVVQLPFWTALAERLRERFGWPIVYDCMDDHAGFSTNCEAMLRAEERTIAEADLVVVTSDVLRREGPTRRPGARCLIRNACDYEHFAAVADERSAAANAPARRHRRFLRRHCRVVRRRSGRRSGRVAARLEVRVDRQHVHRRREPGWRSCRTSRLLGEKPYAELPRLVAGWDCFIIPFKRIPLTEATNPVKAYEMLATGKPVVAVNLPELRPMARDGLLSLADDAARIRRGDRAGLGRRRRRRGASAAGRSPPQTPGNDRCDAFDAAVRELFPPASIIIVTYNNLAAEPGVPGEHLPRNRLSELRGDRGRQRLERRHGGVARRGGGAANRGCA